MNTSIRSRLAKLEAAMKQRSGIAVVLVLPGETKDEALARVLAETGRTADQVEVRVFIVGA